jgi:hypothetical protein
VQQRALVSIPGTWRHTKGGALRRLPVPLHVIELLLRWEARLHLSAATRRVA